MKAKSIAAVVLIAVGTLGLLYRGFNYSRESHEARFGPFKVAVTQQHRVNVPAWAGVLLIAAGVVILVAKARD